MPLVDGSGIGGTAWQPDSIRDKDQRRRARQAAKSDARQRIPSDPGQPEVPSFARRLIDEFVKRAAKALDAHISLAIPRQATMTKSAK